MAKNDLTTDSSASGERKGLFRSGEWLLWALALALVIAGVVRWLGTGPRVDVDVLSVPWHPPELDARLDEAEVLPAAQGALAGWNVLLVTLDTTRPDRLGCYGNREITTPHLDALATEGAIFAHALATTPITLPSHASIMTGLYPHHHGARANGLFPLAEEHTTLAERLAARGYQTAAFVSSFILDARFGLAQGFSVYDDTMEGAEAREGAQATEPLGEEQRWLREASRRFRDPERGADRTTDLALAWLREARDAPFFLWVHYYDPHAAYEPPAPYAEHYAANPYDGEIAFVDAQLGRLLTALDQAGLAAHTLVVVVADHGESLGDHGEPTHSFLLHEATLRVPLMMRAGPRWSGVRIGRPASQTDLAPTILSLLGLDPLAEPDGVDLTSPPREVRPLFAETVQGLVEYGWAPLAAVQIGPEKYIHGPRPELYDLSTDPLEARNLAGERPARAAALRNRLEAAYGSDLEAALSPEPGGGLDPETAARLEALGYVGAGLSASRRGPRADPKAMLPVLTRVQELFFAHAAVRGADVVVEELESIASEHPDFVPTFRYLAQLHRDRGDLAGAERAARRAVELSPESASLANRLFEIQLQRGRVDEATAVLEDLIARHPRWFEGRYNLGVILLSQGDPQAASDQLLRAFEIDPGEATTLDPLLKAMSAAGRLGELEAAFAATLSEDPDLAHVRRALGALRRDSG